MDEYDLKLINLLKENSRRSVSELAELLGVSRQTVRARMEKLEKEGLKYTVKFPQESYFMLIVEAEDVGRLLECDEVFEVNKVSDIKYVLKVNVRSLRELSEVISNLKARILEIMPVVEVLEKESPIRMRVRFRCDYCGKEVHDEPIVYKFRRKVYVFCCRVCLREFKTLNERDI